LAFRFNVVLPGHVMVGGVDSTGWTMNVQTLLFPEASVAESMTTVGKAPVNTVPGAGL
jgi:hypothetical protein